MLCLHKQRCYQLPYNSYSNMLPDLLYNKSTLTTAVLAYEADDNIKKTSYEQRTESKLELHKQ